jgi:GntR family transcriptional regulator, rspAB operon transcriptional repressor
MNLARVAPKPPPSSGAPLRAETAAKLLYRELKADIVSMRRKPGEAIVEREIASHYGVSRTPVREAILRLADEALVDIFPQSGTFVSKIPLGALPEAILIRKTLEEVTAGLAARAADASQVAELHEFIERQRRMQKGGDHERFHQADEAFHAKIAQLAGYPGIWTLIQQVKVQVDRYRRLTLPVPGRMAQVLREHAAIAKAIEAGDSARAANAMAAHLDGLTASIADVRDLNPGLFR